MLTVVTLNMKRIFKIKIIIPCQFLIGVGSLGECLCFAKNSKIQNVHYIWRDKNILKIGMATLQRYPAGQKFC